MDENAIIERLLKDRGEYPAVARESGVNYQTIIKIATGATKRPYGRTLVALERYYADKDNPAGSVQQ